MHYIRRQTDTDTVHTNSLAMATTHNTFMPYNTMSGQQHNSPMQAIEPFLTQSHISLSSSSQWGWAPVAQTDQLAAALKVTVHTVWCTGDNCTTIET